MKATERQIEAAAKQAYINNRDGTVEWENIEDRFKQVWRARARSVVEAALNCSDRGGQ